MGEPQLRLSPLAFWLSGDARDCFNEGLSQHDWEGRVRNRLEGLGVPSVTVEEVLSSLRQSDLWPWPINIDPAKSA